MPDAHDPVPAAPRRAPRWLPWLAGAAAAAVIAATFWATAPSRTPAQARVESVAVGAFVAAPGADAQVRALAESLGPALREALARTPGLVVPAPGGPAAKTVEGVVERGDGTWRVRLRIVDAAGRTVAARSEERPLAAADALGVELAREVTRALRLPPPRVEHVVR